MHPSNMPALILVEVMFPLQAVRLHGDAWLSRGKRQLLNPSGTVPKVHISKDNIKEMHLDPRIVPRGQVFRV